MVCSGAGLVAVIFEIKLCVCSLDGWTVDDRVAIRRQDQERSGVGWLGTEWLVQTRNWLPHKMVHDQCAYPS
jgi:hypothetical protein